MSISGFSKPPVVGATLSRGVYCEGSHSATTADRAMISEAASRYGHLVPVDGTITGAQWLSAIESEGQAGGGHIVQAVRRVMLVDEFASFCHKTDADRLRQAEADLEAIGLYEAIVHRKNAAIDLPFHWNTIIDLPPGYGFQLQPGAMGTMGWRMLDVLSAPPVGAEAFTPEQAADHGAQLRIMQMLIRHQGYTCLTAQTKEHLNWASQGRGGFARVDALHEVDAAAYAFFEGLYDAGWERGQIVNLCRPAPLFNPFASIRPFECLVHSELVGWRVPSSLVEHYFERIEEDRAPVNRERHAVA